MASPALVQPAEAHADVLAGTPYRALGPLGQGGMGAVIEAEHRALRKRVVVKLLHDSLARDLRMADRLRVEAQALAALSSPNVVSVTDFGETVEGKPFIVMERLHGHTLHEELARRGALPAAEAVGIVRQVLAGLAAAHRVGIIHRDVKLSNVFICDAPDGGPRAVKVLDFGVAKILPRDTPVPVPVPRYATETGALVGSPRTVSPEQARCQKVDERTDVYAVGLALYTLIVGEGPFPHATDILALLNAHVREPPTPPSHVAKQPVPPELDHAILKALAKRPEHRFQSAGAFSEELGRVEAVLTGTTQPIAPAARAVSADDGEAETVVRVVARGPSAAGALRGPAGDPPLHDLPANLAPLPQEQVTNREFAFAILVSTAVFGLIAAFIFRYLGYGVR